MTRNLSRFIVYRLDLRLLPPMPASDIHSLKSTRRRVLNPRAALIVGCLVVGTLFGTRRLHSQQLHRTRDFLRGSAMQALAAEDYRTAYSLLNQYLAMRSSDVEATERLSQLLVDHVGTPVALERAFRLNEDLLRDNLPQHVLRLRQARLAVQLQRFSDADAHLQILQSALPDSSEVWYLSGQTEEAMRLLDDAAQSYQRAMDCPDPVPEAFAALVRLTSTDQPDDPTQAEAILQRMLTLTPSATAFRIRAQWLMEQRRFQAAEQDVWAALQLEPADIRLNAMLVQCLQNQDVTPDPTDNLSWPAPTVTEPGTTATAPASTAAEPATPDRVIAHFQQLTAAQPRQPLFAVDLAAVLWQAGRRADAIRALEGSIQANPQAFVLHRALIEYLLSDQQVARARQVFELLPADGLSRSETEYLHGRLLMAEEHWTEAAQVLDHCIAFSPAGSPVLLRARMALAMARRHGDDRASALEACRNVLLDNPNSVSGRLGMAAEWLATEQLDLAIAEYRQLLDVPGVPAWLASLLIQRSLKLPPGNANWQQVEQLVRDDQPLIDDPAQRILLQTDLLLAQGHVTAAIARLEYGTRQYPDRVELSRALRRMNGELSSDMRDRLQQLVLRQPDNVEAHAAILRLALFARDTNAAEAWLNAVRRGQQCAALPDAARQQLIVNSLQLTAQLEQAAGRDPHVDWLQTQTVTALQQLVQLSPQDLPQLVQQLVRQGAPQEAATQIQTNSASAPAEVAAVAWLELARCSTARQQDIPLAAQGLRQLIARQPADLDLRAMYAELLLYAEEYSAALETLRQIRAVEPAHRLAQARTAWILAVTQEDLATALQLADAMLATGEQSPLISEMLGRVLISAGQYQRALDVLQSGRSEGPPSACTLVCQAAAQLHLQQPEQARRLVDEAVQRQASDPLLPADERLLQSLRETLDPASTAQTEH